MAVDRLRLRLVLRVCGSLVTVGSLAVAVCCWASYRQDRARLGLVAREVVASITAPSEQVLALLHWVNRIEGSSRNDGHFGWRRLRATPAQVLHGGGDCADKSRLMAALLREVGIPASMAICLDGPAGRPAHTIVEARIGTQDYRGVDPAFDLQFPKPNSAGYYDLRGRRPSFLPALVRRLRHRHNNQLGQKRVNPVGTGRAADDTR